MDLGIRRLTARRPAGRILLGEYIKLLCFFDLFLVCYRVLAVFMVNVL